MAGFGADPIDGSVHRWLSHQPPFEGEFPWKIDADQSDQDGQDSLAGEDQHDNAGQDKNDTAKVLGDQQRESEHGMPKLPSVDKMLAAEKKVVGNADDQPGDGDQTAEKHQSGDRAQPAQQNFMPAYPIQHGD